MAEDFSDDDDQNLVPDDSDSDPNVSPEGLSPAVAAAIGAGPNSSSEDDSDDSSPDKPTNPIVQDYLAKLSAAQAKTKQNQLGTGIGAAITQLSHGLSRASGEADLSGINALAKNNDAPLTSLAAQQSGEAAAMDQQRQADLADPDSDASKAARQNIQANFPKIADAYGDSFDQLTANDVPNILKVADTKAAIDERAQAAQLRSDTQNQMHQFQMASLASKQDAAQDKADEKTGVDLQTKLDSSGARAGNFGKAGNMIMAADRIKAILDQYPDGNIPKAQTEELASAQAALVGGGSIQSQQQLNAIVPQSVWGNANAFTGWLTNNPRGLGQQEFIKNLADSAQRERNTAQSQVDAIKAERLSAYNDFANRNPKKFSQIIKGAGLDPKNYDFDSGQYTPASAASSGGGGMGGGSPSASHPQDSQAVQWAKANPGDPRAAKILQLNGAQ